MVYWYLTTAHLAYVAKVFLSEGTPAVRRWNCRCETKLYQDYATQLMDALKDQAGQPPREAEALLKETGYFDNKRKRMNFLDLRSEGYPICSEMVASTGKQYKASFYGAGIRLTRKVDEQLL
ncbi:MAG: hypothetical protein IBX69_16445 [Anaerolineales bacterium]|nr:hypothetical protein [Anaerolineales bacterium]